MFKFCVVLSLFSFVRTIPLRIGDDGNNNERAKRILDPEETMTLENSRTIAALTQRIATLESTHGTHSPVAFNAHLTKSVVSPGSNQHVVFDDVQLNLGSAYNSISGFFQAPVRGVYMFSVAACSYPGHFIVLDLMKNGTVLMSVLAGENTSFSACASKTVVAELTTGDQIFVKHHGSEGDYIRNHDHNWNSFTGVLIQQL